jgi:hypothetical protein
MMLSGKLSHDQITYWSYAQTLSEAGTHQYLWRPIFSFSHILAFIHRFLASPIACFILVYVCAGYLYLLATYWSMRQFLKNDTVCTWIAVASIVPHYTLGMTYWGFAGLEFVSARMLIMPLVPLIIRWAVQDTSRFLWMLAPILCASAAALNFEAFYLLAALFLLAIVTLTGDAGRRTHLRFYAFGYGVAALLGCLIFAYADYGSKHPTHNADMIARLYQDLIRIHTPTILNMSSAAYTALVWESARAGFWWALFPPGLSEIVMAAGESIFVILAAVMGFLTALRNKQRWAKDLFCFSCCVLLVAYGYQAARYFAGMWLGWPADIFEEVRAFKFVYFSLYVGAGYYLLSLIRSQRRWTAVLVTALLLISPLNSLRMLPDSVRVGLYQSIITSGMIGRSDAMKQEYVAKALGYQDPVKAKDIKMIVGLLDELEGREPAQVLTDLHEVKLAKVLTFVSYQDKRGARTSFRFGEAPRQLKGPYWYLAYREITAALTSGDPTIIRHMANKYGCDYCIVRDELKDGSFKPLYDGAYYRLYRIDSD